MKLTEILRNTGILAATFGVGYYLQIEQPKSYTERCERTEIYEDRIEVYVTSESHATIYPSQIKNIEPKPKIESDKQKGYTF